MRLAAPHSGRYLHVTPLPVAAMSAGLALAPYIVYWIYEFHCGSGSGGSAWFTAESFSSPAIRSNSASPRSSAQGVVQASIFWSLALMFSMHLVAREQLGEQLHVGRFFQLDVIDHLLFSPETLHQLLKCNILVDG